MQIEIIVKKFHRLFFWRVIGKDTRSAVNKYIAWQQRAVDLQRLQRIREIVRQTLSPQRQ
ncbi:hypothetical protein NGUA15_00954 [Salmonella enterica]|nr:hypothetical protein NGUA15_00954 [Salmonella enterica]CPR77222.1 Uncharacterised protein [Salmonella enterica subsp. enterica serovar Bovismorbificans]